MATSVTITQSVDIVTPPIPGDDNYTLETTFSSSLPWGGVWDNRFLLIKIIDPLVSADDVYQSVCTIADLEKYLAADRAAAVIAGDIYYRIATWTLYFENLEDAHAAALLQRQKTQYLVDDWEAYSGSVYPVVTVTAVTST